MRNKKNIMIFLIIYAFIFSMVGVFAANILNSKDILFTSTKENWNPSNLEEAINDLYSNKKSNVLVYQNYFGVHNTANVEGKNQFTIDYDGKLIVNAYVHDGLANVESGYNYYFKYNNSNISPTSSNISTQWNRYLNYEIDVKKGDIIDYDFVTNSSGTRAIGVYAILIY